MKQKDTKPLKQQIWNSVGMHNFDSELTTFDWPLSQLLNNRCHSHSRGLGKPRLRRPHSHGEESGSD